MYNFANKVVEWRAKKRFRRQQQPHLARIGLKQQAGILLGLT